MTIFDSGGIQIRAEQETDEDGNLIFNHFIGGVLADHAQINQLPTGRALLNRLKAHLLMERRILIARDMQVEHARTRRPALRGGEGDLETLTHQATAARDARAATTRSGGSNQSMDSNLTQAGPGQPVDGVKVKYDPVTPNYANATYQNPSWIVLAHELIHALHYLDGEKLEGVSDHHGEPVPNEELRTVGLGAYANEAICENRLRHEAGLTLRNQY